MVILFCKGENEVLKTVCFNGTYTQAEDYINDRAEIPEGTTRTLIVPEENYIFNIDESLRRENEAFEQARMQENCEIHKRKKIMEKELNIIPPIGYEVDRQKSTFEKIIFKKIPENPKTWEEYCSLMKGKTVHYTNCNNIIVSGFSDAHNKFVTKERAEQFIALGKLLQLRDYWVRGYNEFKYALFWTKVGITITDNTGIVSYSLTFPTKEMADDFKNCFVDLFRQAYPLV